MLLLLHTLTLLLAVTQIACSKAEAPAPSPLPPPGTKLTPENAAGDHSFTLTHNGTERSFLVHAPKNYNGTVPLPIVMYLHGGGGDSSAALNDGMGEASEKFGFLLVAPNGVNKQWNGGMWEGGSCCGTNDDVGFISTMLSRIQELYAVNSLKVYATGISNGGLMTNRLACELSTRITAVATVAPAARPLPCSASRAVPVMDIHGTGDRCNPFNGGTPPFSFCADQPYTRMSAIEIKHYWKATFGCSATTTAYYEHGNAHCVKYAECGSTTEFAFCQIDGMGHTWPSGAQYLPAFMIGPVSNDISFDQIWAFLNQYSL